MTKKRERALDRSLRGDRPADPETAALVEAAGHVEGSLAVDAPDAERERTIFVAGIRGAKRPFPFFRLFAPAVAVASILLIAFLGRSAVPGDSLYPVRKALNRVGLAPSPTKEINTRIDDATRLLEDAEIASRPDARRQTLDAIYELGRARDLLPELGSEARAERSAEIAALEGRAIAILDDLDNAVPAPFGGRDNSGPGSGEDDGDSSGPGSGEDDDDSSGPGS